MKGGRGFITFNYVLWSDGLIYNDISRDDNFLSIRIVAMIFF